MFSGATGVWCRQGRRGTVAALANTLGKPPIAALMCILFFTGGYAYGEQTPSQSPLEAVRLGVMTPVTGGAAGYGHDIAAGAELAILDFNSYLAGTGEKWRFVPYYFDTQTNPAMIEEAFDSLDVYGVRIISGPAIDIVFDPAVLARDAIMLSCCSVTDINDSPDDNLYRMTPNQYVHGGIMADIMWEGGKQVMIPVGRDNPWITEILGPASEKFESMGGLAAEPLLYTGQWNATLVETLADTVRQASAEHGDDSVGVLYVGFEETYPFLDEAVQHESLRNVQWFGADANTILAYDSFDAAMELGMISVQPTIEESVQSSVLTYRLAGILDRIPSVYAFQEYDAIWMLGHAILDAKGSGSVSALTIPEIRESLESLEYAGMTGHVKFDESGDRISMNYGIWEVQGSGTISIEEHTLQAITGYGSLEVPEAGWVMIDTVLGSAE